MRKLHDARPAITTAASHAQTENESISRSRRKHTVGGPRASRAAFGQPNRREVEIIRHRTTELARTEYRVGCDSKGVSAAFAESFSSPGTKMLVEQLFGRGVRSRNWLFFLNNLR
jgi:hypothetical protein